MSTISINKQTFSELCTGCRSCEVACSFHHTRGFSPTHSSIKVSQDHNTGGIWLTLEPSCDYCDNEEEPLCVKFCAPGALSIEASGLHVR